MELYHFTDSRNLLSIKKLGLLSWPILFECNISSYMGSNQLSRNLDERKGFERYVRLALQPRHRMLNYCLMDGRINQAIWLSIDDSILMQSGIFYSNTNAAANRAIIDNDPDTALNGDDQAEILIPERITTNYILNI